ncbi:hypothetical protein C0Q70_18479 [Pomacea canaliculata]|uniref:Uncharacterized protein n=1 Tax=Pomacea canaliculata TaxID=400727 RepID=A0A2T7NGP9_POMCA|nr:hypothetical protein C0Q70_18479 [Pomacea canaliculata]
MHCVHVEHQHVHHTNPGVCCDVLTSPAQDLLTTLPSEPSCRLLLEPCDVDLDVVKETNGWCDEKQHAVSNMHPAAGTLFNTWYFSLAPRLLLGYKHLDGRWRQTADANPDIKRLTLLTSPSATFLTANFKVGRVRTAASRK